MKQNILTRIKDRAGLEYEILKMNVGIRNFTPKMLIAATAASGFAAINIASTTPNEKPKTEQTINKQTLEGKTVTGYVVNENNQPWNNQLATILLGDSTVASDTIRNGYFTIENIITSVENEQGTTPKEFTLSQNYPNPFNPHTNIEYTLNKASRATLKVWDMQGREVKTLLNNEANAGTHSVVWDATNNDGKAVASGVYFYTLTTNNNTVAKKMVYVKGVMTTSNASQTSKQTSSGKANKNNQTTSVASDDYKLKISGQDVMTKTQNIDLSAPTPINAGTINAPSKPVLTGFVYDLDTKYDAAGNRLTPKGIDSMKISLKSNPETFTLTDSNGQFRLKLETIPADKEINFSPGVFITIKDTLQITGASAESSQYYNYNALIHEKRQPHGNLMMFNELKPGECKITAIHDTTGIPMFKRYVDSNGVDLLDFLMDATVANSKWIFPSFDFPYTYTTPRFRDENLPLKVYLNRSSAPNNWYADSTWSGLKALTGKRFQLTETPDSNNAQIILYYNLPHAGQGESFINYDTSGPYIEQYRIWLGGWVLQQYVPHLAAHELVHSIWESAWHSPYVEDVTYTPYPDRYNGGYPVGPSTKESKARDVIYNSERNIRLIDYKK